jgi:hypothetical protein
LIWSYFEKVVKEKRKEKTKRKNKKNIRRPRGNLLAQAKKQPMAQLRSCPKGYAAPPLSH